MRYSVTIKLLSDTIIGSAESFSSLIDTDIVYDDYGLPYIPAKRVKGILRNSAEDLIGYEGIGTIVPSLTLVQVNRLFGLIGYSGQREEFFLSNLYLDDYNSLVTWLKHLKQQSGLITTQNVLSHFTELRKQTAMDEDRSGVAKEHSLRTSRVINKGFVFKGAFTVSDEIATEVEDFLGLISIHTTSIGTNRNRGLGEIDLDICKPQSLKKIMREKLEALYDTQH
jgi:CRISPR-associated protein Csx10